MRPEETIEYPLRLAWNKIAKLYNTEAAKYDTTMTAGFILLNIDKQLGTPSTKLGPLLGLEPRSLVRTLSAMEQNGLITRKSDPKDKRLVRIHLTDLGLEKRSASKSFVIHLNKKIQDNLDSEQLQVFFSVLQQINQELDNNTIFSDFIYPKHQS